MPTATGAIGSLNPYADVRCPRLLPKPARAMDELQERRRLLQPACPHPTPALFLDRDGVLIEDKHHLCDPAQVVLCQGSQVLVSTAHQQGWPVVVITNQSGIARGYFDWPAYERVTDQLLWQLGESAPLAGIYANGHGPDSPAGSWRKPSPAMLLEVGPGPVCRPWCM